MRPILVPLTCLVLLLAGCQSAEERADAFFRSGVELREAGDLERAALEFRNVFRFDGAHREARTALAEILLEQGRVQNSYSQYLRLAEQYPDDVETRIAMARIAQGEQAWDELRRHGAVAVEQAPDRPEVQAITAMIDYMDASNAEDAEGQADALARAEALVEAAPGNDIALRLVIIGRLQANDLVPALEALDAALAVNPGDRMLKMTKLQVLNALGLPGQTETLLLEMYADAPEDEEILANLIAWYVQRGELDAVGRVLRERADAPEADPDVVVALVRFLGQTEGREAARAELAARIAATEEEPAAQDRYVREDAALAFDMGARDEAVALLRARLDDAAETTETNAIRTLLARMLMAEGNVVGARALIEAVLAEDATDVTALKMQASWLIEGDQPDEAIAALRAALDQAPRDADILTLMARAHQRAGNTQLVGERLALAVEVSGNGVGETLRYARFLTEQGRTGAARALFEEALSANPGDIDLLTGQARLALTEGDTAAARGLIARLERSENPAAADRATGLRAAMLLDEERFDEGIALLERRAEGDVSSAVVLDVVRTRLRAGQVEEARAYLEARLAERPDELPLRLAGAILQLADGEAEAAEATLRELIEAHPQAPGPVRQLYLLLVGTERPEEAGTLLEAAVERLPEARDLLLLQAGRLEQADDMEGALALYERVYELNTDDAIAANNYASLLSDLRDDPESLARAEAVARRLADIEVPAFQDTYGWIAYRQGRLREALRYLEPAAEGLPDNPVVLYHLGMTYLGLERTEEAREVLTRAVELGAGRDMPQVARAREALEGL